MNIALRIGIEGDTLYVNGKRDTSERGQKLLSVANGFLQRAEIDDERKIVRLLTKEADLDGDFDWQGHIGHPLHDALMKIAPSPFGSAKAYIEIDVVKRECNISGKRFPIDIYMGFVERISLVVNDGAVSWLRWASKSTLNIITPTEHGYFLDPNIVYVDDESLKWICQRVFDAMEKNGVELK